MSDYRSLIISPHCDDEVLGCGGIMYNRLEDNVFVYYLGVEDFHVVDKKTRISEVDDVSKFLKFDYRISNNVVNNYNRCSLINEITNIINEVRPTEIFIPNPSYNQDHIETYHACIVALRPHDINYFVPNVFIYEVDQYKTWQQNDWEPNYFEKIDIYKKIDSYNLHRSQVRNMRPTDLLEKFAYIYGISSKFDYAESFKILRMTKKM